MTLVAPLYYLVLDLREEKGKADAKRENYEEEQDAREEQLSEMQTDIHEIREQLNEVAIRSEYNQKHLHDLLLEHDDEEDGPLTTGKGNGHDCPLGDACPWHGATAQ